MRKLLTSVLSTGIVAVMAAPALAADNDKKDPEPVPGDYPATVGPHTTNKDAVKIIEERLGEKANGAWGPELTRELAKFQERKDGLRKDREVGRRTLAALRGRDSDKLPPRGPLTDAQAWWLGLEPRPERVPATSAAPATEPAVEETASAPAPAPEESYGSTGGAGGTLAEIRACESGGDYSAVSSSGYGGAYQFDQQTWQSVGGTGSPAAASPAEQDKRAQMLLNQRGTSPWPVCGG